MGREWVVGGMWTASGEWAGVGWIGHGVGQASSLDEWWNVWADVIEKCGGSAG